MFNSCQKEEDCPANFYCDMVEGNLCTSKLKTGRMCTSDGQCACEKCVQVKHLTRLNKPPIIYHVCDSC